MRTADAKPDHARRNLGSIDRDHQDQCDTASSTARKVLKTKDEGHHCLRGSEFKTARERTDQGAISRLLSRGDRNSEPPEGA